MKTIALHGKYGEGKFALVDDEDYEWLSQFNWCADKHGYAKATLQTLTMHRLLAKTPKGLSTDHVNRNRLDNRKVNLDICTLRENNRRKDVLRKLSGFVGATRCKVKVNNPWRARLKHDGRDLNIGFFPTEHLAALAHDMWEVALRPNDPNLNFKPIAWK